MAKKRAATLLSPELIEETDVVIGELRDIGRKVAVLNMTVGADFEVPEKAGEAGEASDEGVAMASVEEQYVSSLELLEEQVHRVIDLRVQVVQRDALVREGKSEKEGA